MHRARLSRAAVASLFGDDDPEIRVLGTRHGEKLYESLLSREELQKAEDRGDYFRVPLDARSLEYELFFDEGERERRRRGLHLAQHRATRRRGGQAAAAAAARDPRELRWLRASRLEGDS